MVKQNEKLSNSISAGCNDARNSYTIPPEGGKTIVFSVFCACGEIVLNIVMRKILVFRITIDASPITRYNHGIPSNYNLLRNHVITFFIATKDRNFANCSKENARRIYDEDIAQNGDSSLRLS